MISAVLFALLAVPAFEAPVIIESVENLTSTVVEDWDVTVLSSGASVRSLDVSELPAGTYIAGCTKDRGTT